MKSSEAKIIEVDVKRLKKHVSFDYLEVLELDDPDSPTTFTEHPVPAKVARPKTGGFWIASARTTMRLKGLNTSPVMRIPRTQLAKDWKHDILTVFVNVEGMAVVLIFHSREPLAGNVDTNTISGAVTIT